MGHFGGVTGIAADHQPGGALGVLIGGGIGHARGVGDWCYRNGRCCASGREAPADSIRAGLHVKAAGAETVGHRGELQPGVSYNFV